MARSPVMGYLLVISLLFLVLLNTALGTRDGLLVTAEAQTETTIKIKIDTTSTPYDTFEVVCMDPNPCPGPYSNPADFTESVKELTGFEAGTRYGFEIISKNGTGNTDPDPRPNAITHRFCTQPAAPQNVQQDTSAYDAAKATIQWTADGSFKTIPKYGTNSDESAVAVSIGTYEFSTLTSATCTAATVRFEFTCVDAETTSNSYTLEGTTASTTLCTAPAKAKAITTSAITSSSITVSLDVTSGPTTDVSYTIDYEVTGGAAETPVTGQTGATYQITGLTSCTKYDITVTPVLTKTSPAVTIPGDSETKTEVWTVPDNVNEGGTQTATGTDTLKITGIDMNGKTYEKLRAEVTGSEDSTNCAVSASIPDVEVASPGTDLVMTDLSAGCQYNIDLYAQCNSVDSTTALTRKYCTKPAKVTNFASTACTANTISMTWDPVPNTPDHSFQIKRGATGTYATQTSPYTPTGLTASTTYAFFIQAFFTCGTPGPGDTVTSEAEETEMYTAPAQPSTISAGTITTTAAKISFTKGSTVTGWELTYTDRSTSTASTPTTQPAAADIEADLSGLASCETYDVSLVPVYNGCKGTAATVDFTTKPVKVVTTNIAQSAVATDSMTLNGFSDPATVKWESIEFSVSSSDTTGCSATPTATLVSTANPLEIQITGLNQGCEWDIEMKAKCGTQSSDTAHSVVKFCTKPETPTPTQDEASTTTTEGGFSWADASPAADKYFIESPTGSSPTEVSGSSPATTTLAARTCRDISFYAQTACQGDSPYTINGEKKTLTLCPLPPEPTVALTQDEEKLTLTFSVSSPAPTKYETCWKLSSATTPCTSIDPSTSPQDLTSLASCTKYDYTVYTVENNLKSNSTTATDKYTLPKPINTGTTQSAESTSGFTIDDIGVTGGSYEGLKATITSTNPATAKCPMPTTTEFTASTAVTSLVITGLSPGCEYTLDIVATCDSGSAESKTATSVKHCTLPEKPQNLAQSECTVSSVKFTWDDPNSVVPSGYQAKLSTGTDADWADVPAGSKEFTISSGLTAEGTATVEVRSKLSCDNSDSDTLYSDAATLSVNTSPSPTTSAVTSQTATSITVSLGTAPAGSTVTSYDVVFLDSAGTTTVETLTPATPVTSATSTVTLTECTAYDVSVTAKNGVCLAAVKSIDDAYTAAANIVSGDLSGGSETTTGFTISGLPGSATKTITASAARTNAGDTGCTNTFSGTGNAATLDLTGLSPGCSYDVTLEAACGGSANAADVTFTYCTKPVTPTLTWDTGTLSNSAATVTWSHETPVASSYQIRKDTPTSWEAVANTLATKTVSGFSAGTCDKLEFQALLTCDGPVTIEGAIENVDVCAVPNQPSITPDPSSSTKTSITFTYAPSPASPATDYTVVWVENGGSTPTTLTGESGTTTITSLSPCTGYDVTAQPFIQAPDSTRAAGPTSDSDTLYTAPSDVTDIGDQSTPTPSTTGFTISSIGIVSTEFTKLQAQVTATNPGSCAMPSPATFTGIATETKVAITGLAAGCEYTFALRALCSSDDIPSENDVTAIFCTAPATPTAPTQSTCTDDSVTLTWSPSTEDGYDVYSVDNSAYRTDKNPGYTESSLQPVSTYKFKLRSYLDCPTPGVSSPIKIYSADSPEMTAYTSAGPVTITQDTTTKESIKITYAASPTHEPANWIVTSKKTSTAGPGTAAPDIDGATYEKDTTGLDACTEYTITAKAKDVYASDTVTCYSPEASEDIYTAPEAVTTTGISQSSDTVTTTAFTLEGLAVDGNGLFQTITVAASSSDALCTESDTVAVTSPATTAALSGLEPGCTYSVSFQSACGGSNSADAPTKTFCTSPEAPSGLTASTKAKNSITFTWTDNSPAVSAYKIRKAGAGSFFSADFSSGSPYTGLTPSTPYDFELLACLDCAGTELCSAAASLTAITAPEDASISVLERALTTLKVKLDTSPSGSPVDSWLVEWSPAGTGGSSATVPATGTTPDEYTITGLAAGTKYAIKATPSFSGSAGTIDDSSLTSECTKPGTPNLDSLVWSSIATDELQFTGMAIDSSSGYDSFEISATCTGGDTVAASVSSPNTAGTISALTPGCPYAITVKAKCNAVESDAITSDTQCTIPDNPSAHTLPVDNTYTSFKVSQIGIASGVRKEYRVNATTSQNDCANGPISKKTITDEVEFTELDPGCNYAFTIVATCEDSTTNVRESVTPRTFSQCVVPDETTGSSPSATIDSIELSMEPISKGSATTFKVTYTPADTNGATALSPDVSGATLPATATMSDLTPGTEYTITITAYCETVASGQPKTLTVTTSSTKLCDDGSNTYTITAPTQECDGVNHCPDGTDEAQGCSSCAVNSFKCHDNAPKTEPSPIKPYFELFSGVTCIPLEEVCNGINDCGDYSDEEFCDVTLPSNTMFKCDDNKKLETVSTGSQVCDGFNDCGGNTWTDKDSNTQYGYQDEMGCSGCTQTQYSCYVDLTCVEGSKLCDGNNDCGYYEDEIGCDLTTCGNNQFQCPGTSQCEDAGTSGGVCDGENDCGDYTDELNCNRLCSEGTGTSGQFYCADDATTLDTSNKALCISQANLCDGLNHCHPDYKFKDEMGCGTCSKTQFFCQGTVSSSSDAGGCLEVADLCNEKNDCGDWSDEINCYKTSCDDGFFCSGTATPAGECLTDLSLICDGINNCGNAYPYAEEIGCGRGDSCTSIQFKCPNAARCLDKAKLCDGNNDCGDYSDELGCDAACATDPSDEFYCPTIESCIAKSKTCDGNNDCGAYEDEKGCISTAAGNPECSNNEILCALDATSCLDDTLVCNGANDCGNVNKYEDEQGCDPPSCSGTSFKCKDDNECVPADKLCDDTNDCLDQSDELSCVATCFTAGSPGTKFDCPNVASGALPVCLESDGAGAKTCDGNNDCGTEEYYDEMGCGCTAPDEFQCADTPKTCIAKAQICDGENDCGAYEDEHSCDGNCAGDEFECSNYATSTLCVSATCDGVNDCGDYSDEWNCGGPCASDPSTTTNSNQFFCGATSSPGDEFCIAYSKTCDGVNDCGPENNYADEKNCEIDSHLFPQIFITFSSRFRVVTRHSAHHISIFMANRLWAQK